jgi:glycosyltransferase involved in cell wall biosynthesis
LKGDASAGSKRSRADSLSLTFAVGARDTPTDGVRDFVARLACALEERSVHASTLAIPWSQRGWRRALTTLPTLSGVVLIQYTHLAWSRRGFPVGALAARRALLRKGATVGIIFHDPSPFSGRRLRDRVRTATQRAVVRRLARKSPVAFSTVEPELLAVFEGIGRKPRFLPVGSNVPAVTGHTHRSRGFVVSVFSVTKGHRGELLMLADIIQRTARVLPSVSLRVFGRGATEAEEALRSSIDSVPVIVEGVMGADEVSERIASSDALLFVRGEASSRRGTIVAAICNGVPVVAPEGPETGPALRAAGVCLFPRGDNQAAADALVRLASDSALSERQRVRQLRSCETTYSWSAIAGRLLELL